MPDDRTIDFVVMFLVFGMIGLGLLSMLVGWAARTWDRLVNRSDEVMSSDQGDDSADEADRQTDRPSVSADDQRKPRWEVDRTRAAVLEELLYSGWTVADFRREGIFRGDNGTIGAEVEAARQRLGIDPPERMLRVRDEKGERVISY